jgi:hypothetical protein
METIFNEIEQEAIAYFKNEEKEKERVNRVWLMRSYYALKDNLTAANREKDKARANAVRKELKEFRKKHNLIA